MEYGANRYDLESFFAQLSMCMSSVLGCQQGRSMVVLELKREEEQMRRRVGL